MSRRKQAKPRSLKKDCHSNSMKEEVMSDICSDDQESIASLESEVSVGGCSSQWDSGSDEGFRIGSLSPGSSITPTSASETDVEASSTTGVTEATPYQCPFCDKAFPRLSFLKKHEQTHVDKLPFQCQFCGRHFKHKRSRDRHVKLHTGDKKYKCTHCEAAFSRSDHLKIHLRTHDNQKPHQCKHCSRGYSTMAALTAHMQNHKTRNASNTTKNKGCDPSLISRLIEDNELNKTELESQNHIISDSKIMDVNDGPAPSSIQKCPACPYTNRNTAHLQNHILKQHSDYGTERPLSTQSGMSSVGPPVDHSPTSSSPGSRPNSNLASSRMFTSNLLWPLIQEKISCPFCTTDAFQSFESFQLHIQSVHGNIINGELREPNNLLGLQNTLNSFRGSNVFTPLLGHLGTLGSRPVSCELCGVRVNGVVALQRHVVTSHPFTDLIARAAEGVFCAQCLLPFSNPGALAEHVKLVHSSHGVLANVLNKRTASPDTDVPTDLSKRPRRDTPRELPSSTLLCSQCDAPCADFESFRAHLKTHLDAGVDKTVKCEMSLTCVECNMTLGSQTALESHLTSHLEAVTTEYGCIGCSKTFIKPDELQKHLIDIHAHHLYRCTLCKDVFDSKVSIQVHFAVKHSNETKIHKCLRCSLKFSSQAEFDLHLRLVHITRTPSNNNSQNDVLTSSFPNSNGGFRCLLCKATLPSELEMTAHLSTHQRQFQCSLCEEAFHVEFLLDRHVQSQHCTELNGTSCHPENLSKGSRSPKEYHCSLCDIDFTSDSALQSHRKQVHFSKSSSPAKVTTNLSLFCAYCSELCKSRSDLELHMKTHQSNGGRHKCNICDELFTSATTLAQHKLSHIKVLSGNNCMVCKETLESAEQIEIHQTEHYSSQLPQSCVICRQTLVADIEVKVHSNFHASNSIVSDDILSNEIPKKSPPQSTQNSEGLKEISVKSEKELMSSQHQEQTQIEQRNFQCIKCQQSFTTEEDIEAHVSTHLLLEGSLHECLLCNSSLDSPLRLQCHLIEHTFEGCSSYTCYLCSSVFTTATGLQQHMVGHGLTSRPYDCHHCHLKFFFRAELENHLLSHSEAVESNGCHHCSQIFPNIKKYVGQMKAKGLLNCMCKTCDRKFQDQKHLHLHNLTHDGGKPYLCSFCGTGFTRRCEAQRHNGTHSESQDVYSCSLCNEVFNTISQIKHHVIEHHLTPDTCIVRPQSSCSSCDGDYSDLKPKNYSMDP